MPALPRAGTSQESPKAPPESPPRSTRASRTTIQSRTEPASNRVGIRGAAFERVAALGRQCSSGAGRDPKHNHSSGRLCAFERDVETRRLSQVPEFSQGRPLAEASSTSTRNRHNGTSCGFSQDRSPSYWGFSMRAAQTDREGCRRSECTRSGAIRRVRPQWTRT